jgi:hypothetical protein
VRPASTSSKMPVEAARSRCVLQAHRSHGKSNDEFVCNAVKTNNNQYHVQNKVCCNTSRLLKIWIIQQQLKKAMDPGENKMGLSARSHHMYIQEKMLYIQIRNEL